MSRKRLWSPKLQFILSLDESGDHGFPNPKKKRRGIPRPSEDSPPPLVLGGPIYEFEIDQRLDASLNRDIEEILGFKGTLRRTAFIARQGPFIRVAEAKIQPVTEEICAAINKVEFKYIASTCDKIAHRRQYGTRQVNHFLPGDLYLMLFTFVVERFTAFLESVDGGGRIYVEQRGKKEDTEVAATYAELFTEGTEYYKPGQFRDRLIPGLAWFKKDDRKAGLQIADWYNWMLAKKVVGVPSIDEEFAEFCTRIWRGANSSMRGQVGLKTWPRPYGRAWLNCPLDASR